MDELAKTDPAALRSMVEKLEPSVPLQGLTLLNVREHKVDGGVSEADKRVASALGLDPEKLK